MMMKKKRIVEEEDEVDSSGEEEEAPSDPSSIIRVAQYQHLKNKSHRKQAGICKVAVAASVVVFILFLTFKLIDSTGNGAKTEPTEGRSPSTPSLKENPTTPQATANSEQAGKSIEEKSKALAESK
jgi:hypothetical protein